MKKSLLLVAFLVGCGDDSPPEEMKITKLFDETAMAYHSGEWYKPTIDTSWQWQLKDDLNTSYDVQLYDIDLFDTNSSVIQSLKEEGKRVICYFSAGSYENWRSDKDTFPMALLGKQLDGWEDERWLDISNESVASIMTKRLDLAASKGCDGVEPDNMDGYTNDTGFDLTQADQLGYNKFIANQARQRGLSVGLKNDLDQIVELEPFFDFSINEQCHQYNECDKLLPFIEANKPVFNTEYDQIYRDNENGERDTLCAQSLKMRFQTLILPLELDGSFRYSCN